PTAGTSPGSPPRPTPHRSAAGPARRHRRAPARSMEHVPRIVHTFDWPDRFVVGTVGPPGSRTFYLQARSGSRMVSVALEKEQSAALAAKVDEILDGLMATEGNPASVPAQASEALVDDGDLDQPVEEQFRVGMISLGWDRSTSQVVIEAQPVEPVDPRPWNRWRPSRRSRSSCASR